MAIVLPALPFGKEALEPHVSARTLSFHYDKHHAAYVTKTNAAIEGTKLANADLVEIVRSSDGGLFNNAAQVWNHTFFWNSLSPKGGGEPKGKVADLINRDFGSFAEFKKQFAACAANQFGSGWAWLVADAEGRLKVESTGNAATPLTNEKVKPLLTIDVWEHAYYLDYQNARPAFIDAWFNIVNWDFANANLG